MSKGNGKKDAEQTSEDSSGRKMVPQPHGGALVPGAGGGPQPGAGRPPSAVREACRLAFEERIPVLCEIASDTDAKRRDRIKALDVLGKYGGVDKLALTVDEQPETQLTPELLQEMWERIQRIRSIKQFERMLIGAVKGDSDS